MAKGIRDKVAILGMGCSKFGERWDCDADDLIVEAYEEAAKDAGIETSQIDAAWFSTAIEEQHVGKSGVPLAMALRLPYIPVTRVENYCASGSEAFRGASGRGALNSMFWANVSAPGSFAQLAAAYRAKHGVSRDDLKKAMAHISVKSHDNGSRNPKAHLQNKITEDAVLKAPMVAEPLGLFDCCGVSDGAAAAIVTTPEIARSLGKRDLISVKALQLAVSNGEEAQHNSWDGSYFATARAAAKRAYQEAGIDKPREQLSLVEAHDCFSITELVTMEDLFISPEGGAVKDVLDGFYDAEGKVPCQIDGGLKCFGHPIGASGLRMIYEIYLQMLGRAGARQRDQEPVRGLVHNLGGFPHQNVCSIAIIGKHGA